MNDTSIRTSIKTLVIIPSSCDNGEMAEPKVR